MKLAKYILSIALIEICLILLFTSPAPTTTDKEISEVVIDSIIIPEVILRESKKIPVTITKYNPVRSQCDSDPTITADNSHIDLDLLNSYELRWLAVSRDLLNELSMGDTIEVVSSNQLINGNWVVHDVMHKRFSNRIDLLVPVDDNYQFHSPLEGHIQIYIN